MTDLVRLDINLQTPQGCGVRSSGGPLLSRRYVGGAGQQVHLIEGGTERDGAPLYCLHATAYSGQSLAPLVRALAPSRRVAAMDTPGYGASDAPAQRLDLPGYVDAVEAAFNAAREGCIDIFGYHTGALIAAELARRHPGRVRRLVLIGVPFFSGDEQAAWRHRLAQPATLTADLDQFRERWDFFVRDRPPGVDLGKGFENFVDELRAWPNGWWAHDAAFRFDVQECFAAIRQPVLIINPHNHLAAASRQAAAALRRARIVEMPHLANGIFDVAAGEVADLIDGFLNEE
ncbi:alpha/beta fold hydrolase [Brevundimonas sp.]|uniref:alpha/beta fold hydrolase n=1 Tax=Brevundimonas sp. TaxID=1871086 RepID=UPI003D124DC4